MAGGGGERAMAFFIIVGIWDFGLDGGCDLNAIIRRETHLFLKLPSSILPSLSDVN